EGGNQPTEWAEDAWHADVQDQPAAHPCPGAAGLQRVVDVHVNSCSQLAQGDGAVKVERSRRLKSDYRVPPVLAGFIGFPVVITATQSDRIWLHVGGPAERGGPRQPAAVIGHVRKKPEQDGRRRRDIGRGRLW